MSEQAQIEDTVGQAPAIEETANAQAAAAPQVDSRLEQLEAELSKYREEAEKARKEAASRRIKAKEEQEAKIQALAEQQEYKALAEERAKLLDTMKAELEGLGALKNKADSWDAYEQRKSQQIEARLPGLPEQVRNAVQNAPTLGLKRDILSAFDAIQQPEIEASKPLPSKPAPQAAQAETPPPPFDPGTASALDWANLKKQDPERFANLTGVNRAGQKKSIFSQYADRLRK
jgi:chromosome segregation ATPase